MPCWNASGGQAGKRAVDDKGTLVSGDVIRTCRHAVGMSQALH
jgi:hypothetical protein